MTATPDDDLGPLDLDDMPGIPPLVRNARVAAELLFVDPPPAYVVSVKEHAVTIQGDPTPAFVEWTERHHLDERPPFDGWRRWVGRIEGVRFEATCEFALPTYEDAHDLAVDFTTCDKPSCDNHAEPNTSHGLCPSCLDARQAPPLTAYDVILGAPEGAL